MSPIRLRLLSALAGLAAGSAGRSVPIAIAARVVRSPSGSGCGMEEVLECVARNSGTVVVGVARLALAVVTISAVATVVGAVAAVLGLRSEHRAASPLLVGTGVMLMAPALWLAGQFVVFVAT